MVVTNPVNRTVTPALPSVVDTNVVGTEVPADQEPDIAVVRNAIKGELDQGLDVIVVPHSYGGMPTISALVDLGPVARSQAGYQTSVVAIAGISTFVLPAGMPINQNQSKDGGVSGVKGNFLYVYESPGAVEAFYHDLPRVEGEKWAASLKPTTSLGALVQPSKYTAYEDIPVHFLLCTDDRANPVEIQRMVVDRIEENAKAKLQVTEIHCSHSPFLSRVEETTAFLRRAAGEETLG